MTDHPKPTLYHNDLSTCAQKVRVALAEKGMEWESVELDLRAGDTKTPDFLNLNPAGVVPVLVHGDTVVTESTIILEYLEDAWPQVPLRPASPGQKGNMRAWMKRLDDKLHGMTGVLSFALAFRHEYLALPDKGQALLDATTDPTARAIKSGLIEQGAQFPGFGVALQAFNAALAEIEEVLSAQGAGYLAGTYSIADASWTPYINRLEHLGLGFLWSGRPAIARWWESLKGRPSYSQAISNVEKPDRVKLMREKSAAEADRIDQWRSELAIAG